MTSTTLQANGFDFCRRSIIISPTAAASSKEEVISKFNQKNNNNNNSNSTWSEKPPRAFLHIVGICCIYLDPFNLQNAKSHFRTEIFGEDVDFNQKISLQKILKLLISRYDDLMARDEQLGIFADTGLEEVNFSQESQRKAADLFLKSSDDPAKKDDVQVTLTIYDPFGDRWGFSSLSSPGGGEQEKEKNILKQPLPANFFEPKMRYTRPIFSSFDAKGVAERIKQSKRIVVATGAGLSRGAVGPDGKGIPDFRSEGGLYSKMEKYNLPSPESVFTLDYFKKHPDLFYRVSEDMNLWPGNFAPSYGHHFIRLLEQQGKLTMCFTQNIDTLERIAGVSDEKIVEAHGSYATASCVNSRTRHPMDTKELREIAAKGEVPKCKTCEQPVKPDVVFFGEALPERFLQKFEEVLPNADLVLVIGTSLQVFPFALVARAPEKRSYTGERLYPRVLLNMDRVGDFSTYGDKNADNDHPEEIFDCVLTGDCQQSVRDIAEHLGWGEELEKSFQATKEKMLLNA